MFPSPSPALDKSVLCFTEEGGPSSSFEARQTNLRVQVLTACFPLEDCLLPKPNRRRCSTAAETCLAWKPAEVDGLLLCKAAEVDGLLLCKAAEVDGLLLRKAAEVDGLLLCKAAEVDGLLLCKAAQVDGPVLCKAAEVEDEGWESC